MEHVLRPHISHLTRVGDHHVECEDAALSIRVGETVVLAIADGMSTAARAREGSKLAVEVVRHRAADLARALEPSDRITMRTLLREQVQKVRLEWTEACEQLGDAVAFSSTLTIAIWRSPWLAIAGLGDGFALALQDGTAHLVDVPFRDANGLTDSLAGAAPFRITVIYDPGITGVFLSTDGLYEIVRRYPVPGRPLRPSRQPEHQIAGLLDALGSDTDRLGAALALPQQRTADDIGVAYALR